MRQRVYFEGIRKRQLESQEGLKLRKEARHLHGEHVGLESQEGLKL